MCMTASISATKALVKRMEGNKTKTIIAYKGLHSNRTAPHFQNRWLKDGTIARNTYPKGATIVALTPRGNRVRRGRVDLLTPHKSARFPSWGKRDDRIDISAGIHVCLTQDGAGYWGGTVVKLRCHLDDLIGANRLRTRAVFRKMEVIS